MISSLTTNVSYTATEDCMIYGVIIYKGGAGMQIFLNDVVLAYVHGFDNKMNLPYSLLIKKGDTILFKSEDINYIYASVRAYGLR